MGQSIIKIKDRFFIWSTITDSPITGGMDQMQLHRYIRKQSGEEGMRDLAKRLERVASKGTSSMMDSSLEEQLQYNRAGEKETCITADEIYDLYGVEPPGDPVTTEESLREALSIALQFVPLVGKDDWEKSQINLIHELVLQT